MNLEALFGLLQGQDLGKLTEQIGGNSTQVKDGVTAAWQQLIKMQITVKKQKD